MQRPSQRFRSEKYFVYEISKEKFYPNLQRFVWRHHAGAHPDELQHGGRKPTETFVIEFCYKSGNSFFEELINIKVILFLIRELFIAKFPEINRQQEQHNYNARTKLHLKLPSVKWNWGKQRTAFHAIMDFNFLSQAIRQSVNLKIFKRNLFKFVI